VTHQIRLRNSNARDSVVKSAGVLGVGLLAARVLVNLTLPVIRPYLTES